MSIDDFVTQWTNVRTLLEELLAQEPKESWKVVACIRDSLITNLLKDLTKSVN